MPFAGRTVGLLLALLPAAAAAADCPPLPGVERLFARADLRTVIVGEIHGTAETPALFADLVCHAAARERVTVALEYPEAEQPAFDAFMASDGGESARRAFLTTPAWTNTFTDGRSSVAMLAMVERLRVMRQGGAPLKVLLSMPRTPKRIDPARRAGQDYYELAMAARWADAVRADPDGLVLALVGNLHASRAAHVTAGITAPAASHLPKAETIALIAAPADGAAWNCRPRGCGVEVLSGGESRPKGVILSSEQVPGYDGVISPGRTYTASPPAVSGRRATRHPS